MLSKKSIKGSSFDHLGIRGRLSFVGLVCLEGTVSHVRFEICGVWTNFQGKPALTCPVSRWAPRCAYPFSTALHPRGSFSSGNPPGILSQLRIPEQGPATAYGMLPDRSAFQGTGSSGWTHCQGTLPFSPGSWSLLQDELPSCTGHLRGTQMQGSEQHVTPLAIQVGEASVPPLWS